MSVILADTNAWIRHFRSKDLRLVRFLDEDRVHTCDVVIGELLLGAGMPKDVATSLLNLPGLPSPTAAETRSFVQRHQRTFAGSGVGWADVQIVLAASRAGARIYTADRAVRRVCGRTGVAVI